MAVGGRGGGGREGRSEQDARDWLVVGKLASDGARLRKVGEMNA